MDLGPRTQEVLHAQIGRDPSFWERDFPDEHAEYWDKVEDEWGPRHFGFDAEPVSMRVWAILHNAPEKLLEQEWVKPRDRPAVWVSTVWVGLDMNFGRSYAQFLEEWPDAPDTRPWIFETMAFAGEARWFDVRWSPGYGDEEEQVRHATWEEARAFHLDYVHSLRHPSEDGGD